MIKNGEKRIKAEKPRKKISFAALIAVVMSALSFVIIAAMASVLSSSFGDLLSRSAMFKEYDGVQGFSVKLKVQNISDKNVRIENISFVYGLGKSVNESDDIYALRGFYKVITPNVSRKRKLFLMKDYRRFRQIRRYA